MYQQVVGLGEVTGAEAADVLFLRAALRTSAPVVPSRHAAALTANPQAMVVPVQNGNCQFLELLNIFIKRNFCNSNQSLKMPIFFRKDYAITGNSPCIVVFVEPVPNRTFVGVTGVTGLLRFLV